MVSLMVILRHSRWYVTAVDVHEHAGAMKNKVDLGRFPLAGSIRLILLIRAMERGVPGDQIVWHVPKRRSQLIQYGRRLSNVLTMCF